MMANDRLFLEETMLLTLFVTLQWCGLSVDAILTSDHADSKVKRPAAGMVFNQVLTIGFPQNGYYLIEATARDA